MTPAGRRPLLGPVALIAVGAGIGAAAEHVLVSRRTRPRPRDLEPFGLLRGEQVEVLADDGVLLHVEVGHPRRGIAEDLAIVFVHGYSLNQDCWHYQRRDLGDLGRLVFFDQRGHGRSRRGAASRTTIAQLGSDLRRVIEAVSPGVPIVLVGHSMGGMTVLDLAAAQPDFFGERVVGVALLATTSGGLRHANLGLPRPVGGAVRRAIPTALDVATQQQRLVELGREHASDMLFMITKRYSFGSNVPAALTQFVSEMVNGTPVDVIAEYFAEVAGFEAPTAVEQLAGIETLVMVGESDRVIPPGHSYEIVRRAPHAELVLLPSTGHMLMLERWEAVNTHLRELVGRVRTEWSRRTRDAMSASDRA